MKILSIVFLLLAGDSWLFGQQSITVAQDGSGDYSTIQAAVNSIAGNHPGIITVIIRKGIYQECVTIDSSKSFIRFIGENAATTKLTYDNYSSKPDSAGKPFGTTGSSSVFVHGSNITFENLSFENSSGPVGQAVAMLVTGDKVAFKNCSFFGFQDTLYTKGAGSLQYFQNCYIEGTVDFIFGAATAVFENCRLHSKLRGGPVTAASTPEGKKFGYVFIDCNLTADSSVRGMVLGRPWRPFAKTVFVRCMMGQHILSEGWNNWGKSENEKTAYYAEYSSKGPGAAAAARAAWSHQLTEEQAKLYTAKNILDDWRPWDAFKK